MGNNHHQSLLSLSDILTLSSLILPLRPHHDDVKNGSGNDPDDQEQRGAGIVVDDDDEDNDAEDEDEDGQDERHAYRTLAIRFLEA